jgi:hypothetical protein
MKTNTNEFAQHIGSPRRVVFLEFEDEVEAFLGTIADKDRELSDTTIVALSLPAQLALKSRGIPFLNSVSFFNNRSHARVLEQSEKWLQMIESHLDPGEILHKELSYCIRLVFNYLLWLSEVVVQAIETFQPSKVCCPQGKISVDDSRWAMTPKDRFMGFMVEAYAKKNHLEIQKINPGGDPGRQSQQQSPSSPPTRKPGADTFWSRRIRKFFQSFAKEREIVLAATRGYGLDKALEKMGIDSMTFMLLDFETNPGKWRHLKRILKILLKYWLKSRTQFQLYTIPVLAFPIDNCDVEKREEQVHSMVLSLAQRIETGWSDDFAYRGMDTAPCISMKLRTGILNHLLGLVPMQSQLHEVLHAVRPGVVLSPFSSGIFGILGELCQQMQIPGFLVPHGALAPPRNQLEAIEWRRLSQGQMLSPYQYKAAQTPLAAQHAAYFAIEKQTLNTGPILFSTTEPDRGRALRQRLGLSEETFVILYAVAQRQRSSVRFHIFETEDESLSSMIDVVRAVNQMHDEKVHLVLKLHPAFRFPEAQMRLLLPECSGMSILRPEPFAQVLAASDLMVSYISTTVEEALINQTPVVLYDKWKRYRFIEAFDCNGTPTDKWPVQAAYYTSEPGTLVELFTHTIKQSKEKERHPGIFQAYMFARGESQSLAHYVREITGKK